MSRLAVPGSSLKADPPRTESRAHPRVLPPVPSEASSSRAGGRPSPRPRRCPPWEERFNDSSTPFV